MSAILAGAVFMALTLCGTAFLSRRMEIHLMRFVAMVALVSAPAFSTGLTRWIDAEVQNMQPLIDSITHDITTRLTTTSTLALTDPAERPEDER